jgi:hypothetical protein
MALLIIFALVVIVLAARRSSRRVSKSIDRLTRQMERTNPHGRNWK